VLGDLGRIRGAGRDYVDVALGLAPDLRGALPTVGRLGVIFSYLRGQNLEGWAVDVVRVIDL
jgi:hypothetical protein